MIKRGKYIFAGLLLLVIRFAAAQPDQALNIFGYRFFDYQESYLPEALLSSRSAVFMAVPQKPNGSRGDWTSLAEKAHDYLKKIGVDAVAYLYVQDVFSGPEPEQAFISWLAQRKVDNLIHLAEISVNGQKKYRIVITSFNGKPDIASPGQKAWKNETADLERLFINLYRAVGSLKKENFLIVDKPEFFTDITVLTGKRFENYQQDLKLDKLAVPVFTGIPIPDNYPADPLNEELARQASAYNGMIASANERLKEVMSAYPYEYGLVDLSQKTPEQLRNEGYQFVLYYVNTSGRVIKNLLDYTVQPTETDFISLTASAGGSSIKTLPVDFPVYKYYVKHIFTSDVFLGTKWDADDDWEKALTNHLTGLRAEFRIR